MCIGEKYTQLLKCGWRGNVRGVQNERECPRGKFPDEACSPIPHRLRLLLFRGHSIDTRLRPRQLRFRAFFSLHRTTCGPLASGRQCLAFRHAHITWPTASEVGTRHSLRRDKCRSLNTSPWRAQRKNSWNKKGRLVDPKNLETP